MPEPSSWWESSFFDLWLDAHLQFRMREQTAARLMPSTNEQEVQARRGCKVPLDRDQDLHQTASAG
jgi:hypothetical protein